MATRGGSNDIGFKKWKGIVTEQNIGQYEAEAAIDADNVEFLKDGTVQRRLGLELETGGGLLVNLTSAQRQGAAFSTFLWEDINGQPNVNIRALQVGATVRLLADTYPISEAVLYATINLEDFSTGDIVKAETLPCDFAAGAGVMLIVAEGIEPIRVTVDTSLSPLLVTVSQQLVGIRWNRLEGASVTSGLGTQTLTAGHEFDLRNSGWPFRTSCAAAADGGNATLVRTDPAAFFKAKMGVWPKTSILFSALKLGTSMEPVTLGGFSPWEADKLHFGNTIPPKGHYITSAWSFDSRGLMQGDIGGIAVGTDTRWVLQYWQVTGVDSSSPTQRFTAEPILKFVGSYGGNSFKGAIAFAQAKIAPPVNEFKASTAGKRRIVWTTGFNASSTSVSGLGDGRGSFVLDAPAGASIGVGDRFNIS